MRRLVDEVLVALSPQLTAMYGPDDRYSVPPDHLIKARLPMALHSIRSERQFCERLQHDLVFKWFLGLNVKDPAFDHSTFAKNRKRLLDGGRRTADWRGRFWAGLYGKHAGAASALRLLSIGRAVAAAGAGA